MSRCTCSDPRDFRITGEVSKQRGDSDAIGTGKKAVRVRCATCGGKIGRLGSDVLTELFNVPDSEIEPARCLSEAEQRTVTVDLI